MSDADGIARLEEKLDTLIKLLAFQVSDRHPSLTEKAVILRRLGLAPRDIADICGTTGNTINVRLAEAKRKQQPAKKAARSKSK